MNLLSSLGQVAFYLPELMVAIGTAIYAITNWNEHPQKGMLVVTAMALLGVDLLGGIGLVVLRALEFVPLSMLGPVYTVWGMVALVLRCSSLVTLVVAAYQPPKA